MVSGRGSPVMTMSKLQIFSLIVVFAKGGLAQPLPVQWEELTAPDFVQAIRQSGGVCLLPFGIIEKHGPAGPLGTDLINVRHSSVEAAKKEYAVIFPEYYFGQIYEARHQPGTIAYSTRLQLELLQETTGEMARNGCSKIIVVNGHGGNTMLLQYFAQTQLDSPKDYIVYAYVSLGAPPNAAVPAAAAASGPNVDGHAGEGEIANVMASRPDLVRLARSDSQSGADLRRLDLPAGLVTGIGWYSRFPNHYAGNSSRATVARGQAATQMRVDSIVNVIRAVKADQTGPRLQKEFFDAARQPLNTKQ
ncbi:MAG: creatininase family protein [Acidobacteriia bacterium]|nr:creatininase family protein [Terriglobia bacterium]